jgi:clan AA aspartic protease
MGRVTDQPEIIVRMLLRGSGGRKRVITTAIDTGFDGFLTLPSRLITALKFTWHHQTFVELADGSVIPSDVYRGTVEWDGRQRRIFVDTAETDPLLGMALLKGHRLDAEIRSGGKVRIERLPRRRDK